MWFLLWELCGAQGRSTTLSYEKPHPIAFSELWMRLELCGAQGHPGTPSLTPFGIRNFLANSRLVLKS